MPQDCNQSDTGIGGHRAEADESRAGHCARRIQRFVQPRKRSAQWPTLLRSRSRGPCSVLLKRYFAGLVDDRECIMEVDLQKHGAVIFGYVCFAARNPERATRNRHRFDIRQSSFVIPFGFQPKDQIPHVPPSKPMVTFSPSTMIGTLRAPLECFSMVSICLGSLTTL
jgi:hypothetical protein